MWQQGASSMRDIYFLSNEFSLSPDDVDTWTSLNYFKLFWRDKLNQLLSKQTNLYSFQRESKSINSIPGEIEQIVGIHMFMPIINLPAFYMYWASQTRYPHLLQMSCQLLDIKH